MTNDEVNSRFKMLENNIRIMKNDIHRLTHDKSYLRP